MEPREARRQRAPRPVRREFLRTMRRKNSMARRVRREFMPRAPARSRRTTHPPYRARWARGRLVAIRWRLRARCPAGEDDLHRSARRRRRGSLDVALRDALKLRRSWRLLWRRTVGKGFGGLTEEVQFVPAQPYTPGAGLQFVIDWLAILVMLPAPALHGLAPDWPVKLTGDTGRAQPPLVRPRRARSTASRASAFAEERAGGSRLARAGKSGRSNKGRPAIRLS